MHVFRPFALLVLVSCGLVPGISMAAQSPIEDLLRAQQTWQFNCLPTGCIASVDILRGESGDPPDPHDVNQYISVAIGVGKTDHRPSMVLFQVDPKADKSAGVSLAFAHDVADGKSWKIVMDESGLMQLPFTRCDESACIASIGGGKPDDAALKECAELVQKMQANNHLFVNYVRAGHTYRTAVSLALFKEAYQRLLSQMSGSVAGPQ